MLSAHRHVTIKSVTMGMHMCLNLKHPRMQTRLRRANRQMKRRSQQHHRFHNHPHLRIAALSTHQPQACPPDWLVHSLPMTTRSRSHIVNVHLKHIHHGLAADDPIHQSSCQLRHFFERENQLKPDPPLKPHKQLPNPTKECLAPSQPAGSSYTPQTNQSKSSVHPGLDPTGALEKTACDLQPRRTRGRASLAVLTTLR